MLMCINPSFATSEHSTQYKGNITTNETSSDVLIDIPIFLTEAASGGELTEAQKDRVSNAISIYCSQRSNNLNGFKMSEQKGELVLNTAAYETISLSKAQKENVLSFPIFASIFEEAKNCIASGVTIKYINLYVPSAETFINNFNLASTDQDLADPSWWERNFYYFGAYGGYKFLYIESSMQFETPFVNPSELTASMNWSDVLKFCLTTALDTVVDNGVYEAARFTTDLVSTVVGAYNPPLPLTFSPSQEYFKVRVSGDKYTRLVVISDNLNHFNGYAYYEHGSTSKVVAVSRVEAKYRYKQNASGTYEYIYPSYSTPKTTLCNSGYYGNTAFFQNMIRNYQYPVGYTQYIEDISVRRVAANLIKSS